MASKRRRHARARRRASQWTRAGSDADDAGCGGLGP